jgi:hypothetical protein
MISPRECLPREWVKLLGTGPLGIGGDLATTEKETSNPSCIVVTEKVGPLYVERLVLRWKTSREEVSRAMFALVFADLQAAQLRPRRLCLDATNERFFAQSLKKQFQQICPVQLVVASENVPDVLIDGLPVTWKEFTGNLYVNTFADALLRCPQTQWLRDDRRLVKREKGRFIAATAPDGSHADTFDGGKLARLALDTSGRAVVSAVNVGGAPAQRAVAGLRNPLLKLAQQKNRRLVSC